MNAHDVVILESESDCEQQLDEACQSCGVLLRDHYTVRGLWKKCKPTDMVKHGTQFCRDCGEPDETTGHMGCQYPSDHH